MNLSEHEKLLLAKDTDLLTDEEIIEKNKILIENNLNISDKDQHIFKKILKKKINSPLDFISKSKIDKNSEHLDKNYEQRKAKIKHLIQIISDNTGLEAKIIEQTVEDVDIHLDDKMLIRSIFKLLAMRSTSNSLNLSNCIKNNSEYIDEFKEVLEELEKERKKVFYQTILKEFSDKNKMTMFIIQETLNAKEIELDLTKTKEELIEELNIIFDIKKKKNKVI